jgi:hypothetical protein
MPEMTQDSLLKDSYGGEDRTQLNVSQVLFLCQYPRTSFSLNSDKENFNIHTMKLKCILIRSLRTISR